MEDLKQNEQTEQQEIKKKFQPKITVSYQEEELKRIELPDQKGIVVRFLKHDDKTYVDIRRFYKGYPTKKGIRMTMNSFNLLKDLL